jgi:hypothetical protein
MKYPKDKDELNKMNVSELCDLVNSIVGKNKGDVMEKWNVNYSYSDITNAIRRLGGKKIWVPPTSNDANKSLIASNDDILNITIPNSKNQLFRSRVAICVCDEFDKLFKLYKNEAVTAALSYYIECCGITNL